MTSVHLLLLLVSSSLLHLSDSTKLGGFKSTAKKAAKNTIPFIKDKAVPFLGVIPIEGALIAAVANFALGLIPSDPNADVLKKLKSEFESLNIKLDNYHAEQKWDTWASGAYHKPEVKINNAWQKYQTLVGSLFHETDPAKKETLKNEMIRDFSKCWDNTETLHSYLTAKPPTFMSNLGQTLAEKLNCHEKDIEIYRNYIGQLLYKGITLSQLYLRLKEIYTPEQVARQAKVIYDAASAMFYVQRNCIFNSAEYIRKDVLNLMGGTNIDKQKLADEIRSFLAKNYDRYDWMVVVFQTKNSNHDILELLNKHTVDGFMKVERGELTVAVARQVKGSHSKAAEVQQAIDRCQLEPVNCYEVPQKLSECLKDSRPYTAVHAFLKKPRQNFEGKEFGVDVSPENENLPYLYTGRCKKYKIFNSGKFVVMIKSDEERATDNPCSNMDCGGAERGSCVHANDVFVAMCQCNEPFFGLNCEHSMAQYETQDLVGNRLDSNGRQLQLVDNRLDSNGRQLQLVDNRLSGSSNFNRNHPQRQPIRRGKVDELSKRI